MRSGPRWSPLLVWAARDLGRRPGEAALLVAALASLAAVVAAPLLLQEGLRRTVDLVLSRAPALVVRRVGGGGFLSVPSDAARLSAGIPGVTRASARIWGVVGGPRGPVTVVGTNEAIGAELEALGTLAPRTSEAVVGSQVTASSGDGTVVLGGMRFTVRARLGRFEDAVARDVAFLEPEDARRLLGLAAEEATDLALWTLREEEAGVLQPELAALLGGNVRVVTRDEARRLQLFTLARRAGLSVSASVPAVLAGILLALVTFRGVRNRTREDALLSALGWTGGDLLRLQACRALLCGFPAVTLGLVSSQLAVHAPGSPVAAWLLGVEGPVRLGLDPGGALRIWVETLSIVLVPWLLAAFLAARTRLSRDPVDELEAAGW